jgi:hypothetical protein
MTVSASGPHVASRGDYRVTEPAFGLVFAGSVFRRS